MPSACRASMIDTGGINVSEFKSAVKRKASFAQTTRAVLWGFFGVRKGAEHDRDMQLNPIHLILAGVLGCALLVIVLVLVAGIAVG